MSFHLSIKQIERIDQAIALTDGGWNIPEDKEELTEEYSLTDDEYDDLLWAYKYHFENERKD